MGLNSIEDIFFNTHLTTRARNKWIRRDVTT